MKNLMERSSLESWKILSILRRFSTLALALSLFCSLFLLVPSPANAVSFEFDNPSSFSFDSGIATKVNPHTLIGMTRTSGAIAFQTSDYTGLLYRFQLYPSTTLKKGQVYQFNYSIKLDNYNQSVLGFSNFVGFSCEGECMVLDQSFNPVSARSPSNEFASEYTGSLWVEILTDNYWALTLQFNASLPFSVAFLDGSVATIRTSDASSAIINQTEELKNSQQQTTNAVNNQTEQQKNQYEQDKQEEADREQSGKDDANSAGGIFNFSVLNPFVPIFQLFNSGDSCASIPTVSSWLHAEQTSVCPFFPSSVRSIVTPVVGISSMMLIFGFAIRWLGGNSVIHLGGD